MSSTETLPTAAAVIVAGGTGERFGEASGKQMAIIGGEPMLAITLRAFLAARSIREIVLVCHPDRVEEYEDAVRGHVEATKPITAVRGGATRQFSVENGIDAVGGECTEILIHDGARPLVRPELIDRVISALRASPGVDGLVVGHPSFDTLKIVEDSRIVSTPDRSLFWAVQTPQVFRADVLRRAYGEAFRNGRTGTDDAVLVERAGGVVEVIEGSRDNIKVTVVEDLAIVEAILASRGDV